MMMMNVWLFLQDFCGECETFVKNIFCDKRVTIWQGFHGVWLFYKSLMVNK